MDAKPLRPLRGLQNPVSGNENLITAKQSSHQRHKSTGNLKNMAITGTLNAPPKRTAFGDVSNTVRTMGDVAGKFGSKHQVKSAVAAINARDSRVDDKENGHVAKDDNYTKSTAASRASFTGAKYLSTGPVVNTANQATRPLRTYSTSIQPSTTSISQTLVKGSLAKKATAVYLERDVNVASVDDSALLNERPTKNPRHYKSQPQLRTEQPALRKTQSRYLNKCEKIVDVENEVDLPDDITEAAYEDAVEQLGGDFDASPEKDSIAAELKVKQVHVEFEAAPQAVAAPSLLSAPSEPEEYWDEDEDPELYDEHGYTTAHSYSHGDNTTGGVTTLIAPKITTQVEKELEQAKQFVLDHQTEEEIEEEAWDVSMVAEYGEEIFEYMRSLEKSMMPNAHYMDIQTEIQWSMRSVLMDWLVQVHCRFNLLPETLFLTVNYIDRFLSVKIVSLNKLQLVGATAIFVAAKYEEINCPSVQEIVYMVDSGYTVEEILKAERFMLSMLQFELGWPGPMSFLRRISKADDYDLETRTLAKYFLEVTIMDERFVGCTPSYLAAGAHCLSRFMLKKGNWSPAHVHYSGYTMAQLKPLVTLILDCCQDARKHHLAVFEKYATAKYKKASLYVEGEIVKGFRLSLPSTTPLIRAGEYVDEAVVVQAASLVTVEN
ncbi:hypothetical protein OQA88_3345 [Cercophora sp. LCS_1]